ncbi:hypothetical protein CAPTEDRAFT_196790 [Capitella teleta]|uniref:Uncharacterized protein n=1 Tax=Capitella teleta TaxID=283909 RepID=R7TVF5_CAPTE|nr:hypothetical protein CAPTEDRAFT_196790 [Capitella teleta]|eukprot:ELT95446.1 hypothetical protein CAPTEDRAFT_196790 [Capitella teleta]
MGGRVVLDSVVGRPDVEGKVLDTVEREVGLGVVNMEGLAVLGIDATVVLAKVAGSPDVDGNVLEKVAVRPSGAFVEAVIGVGIVVVGIESTVFPIVVGILGKPGAVLCALLAVTVTTPFTERKTTSIEGKRKGGRSKRKWTDNIKEWTGMRRGQHLVQGREEWRSQLERSPTP